MLFPACSWRFILARALGCGRAAAGSGSSAGFWASAGLDPQHSLEPCPKLIPPELGGSDSASPSDFSPCWSHAGRPQEFLAGCRQSPFRKTFNPPKIPSVPLPERSQFPAPPRLGGFGLCGSGRPRARFPRVFSIPGGMRGSSTHGALPAPRSPRCRPPKPSLCFPGKSHPGIPGGCCCRAGGAVRSRDSLVYTSPWQHLGKKTFEKHRLRIMGCSLSSLCSPHVSPRCGEHPAWVNHLEISTSRRFLFK